MSDPLSSTVAVVGFDWDAGNSQKCRAHGLTADEVEEVFRGAPAVFPDPAHPGTETRLRAIGPVGAGRFAFVVFTLRRGSEGLLIRPISARWMHRREIEHYARQTQGAPGPPD
jgi:uncharacterized DUF497 family protein